MNAGSDAANHPLADLDESILLPQLGCPSGEIGIAVGDSLARNNLAVIETAFGLLDLHAGERIVEVGLGNGDHLTWVLDQAPGLHVTGVDISATMIDVGRRRHAALIHDGRIALDVADVAALPFNDASFDKAIGINTTYFWTDLTRGLTELRRVLCADGVLVIAAITPASAAEMPFAAYGFTVHDAATLETACANAGFRQIGITRYVEPLTEPPQENGPREFFLLRACAG